VNTQQATNVKEISKPVPASKGPWQQAFTKFIHNKIAMTGLFFLLVVIIMCVGAPLFTHQKPTDFDLSLIESPPGPGHILGTDDSGRDIWTRLLYGGRASLLVGFSSMVITVCIGVVIGAVAGYYGGIVDTLLMRFTEIIQTFPFVLFSITLVALFNKVNIWLVILAVAVLSWASTARLVRGQFMSLREQEYVLSAKSIGCTDRQIIFRHILPNTIGIIIVSATLSMATFIIVESALSFLGFGVQEPTPSWGNMLNSAQSYKVLSFEWWRWVPPGFAVVLTVLSINLVGGGLRDAFDPKSDH
jgi:peptide/nickel transport system permease protein